MMGNMSHPKDEFAEVDLTEAQIDAMIAEGEPVIVTTFAPAMRLYTLDVRNGGGESSGTSQSFAGISHGGEGITAELVDAS